MIESEEGGRGKEMFFRCYLKIFTIFLDSIRKK
jgi:hypothetical protein